jgi:hypothetical protein
MNPLLLLKLTLVPLFIGAVSLAGRRWGPMISGWLVGLPLTSGPVVFFIALEQGKSFAARTAQATLMGLISVSAFCLTYSWASRHIGWLGSMLAGWAAYFILTYFLNQF